MQISPTTPGVRIFSPSRAPLMIGPNSRLWVCASSGQECRVEERCRSQMRLPPSEQSGLCCILSHIKDRLDRRLTLEHLRRYGVHTRARAYASNVDIPGGPPWNGCTSTLRMTSEQALAHINGLDGIEAGDGMVVGMGSHDPRRCRCDKHNAPDGSGEIRIPPRASRS